MISPKLSAYPLNEEQRIIVSHKRGPLHVIAGPGSGKTRSLTLLAMNLLLCNDAQPSELVLCTYTEKAAYEMQDRITRIANDIAYKGDLSQMRIGTIHSICNQFITENLHHTPLGNNYETLDQFPQQLLIFEHLATICPSYSNAFFQERWGSPWKVAKKLQFFFDKIAEELIFEKLKAAYVQPKVYPTDRDMLLFYVTQAYVRYQRILTATNRIDFAHLQKCMYNLLTNSAASQQIIKGIRYVLVDEYQDTNYIQEQILTALVAATVPNNLCVVGDEDQALYRFRGATVRNILEFAQKFPGCKEVKLTTNYRSHPYIIETCNAWINTTDWSNPEGRPFRTEKTVHHVSGNKYYDYPSVFTILDHDVHKEAEQFAQIVASLKRRGRITDYNQVALLLHSVRAPISDPYREALAKRDIPSFCPRARAYFQAGEVRLLIGCFVAIIGYRDSRGEEMISESTFPTYLAECDQQLAQACQVSFKLDREIQAITEDLQTEEEEPQQPGRRLADFFYRLTFTEPLVTLLQDERKRQNLVLFSLLLHTFQNYYRHGDITQYNKLQVASDLFDKFFCLLYEDGMNQYENPRLPFPTGHVQILTVHQAKGLEFPVIVVGRLDKLPPHPDNEDRDLQSFYSQKTFEPDRRIPAFDLGRFYYVAFSRAKSLLILSAHKRPHAYLAPLWQKIPAWPAVQSLLQKMPRYEERDLPLQPKPRYSFTNHVSMYTTCPRQFQFFREYNFVPSHSIEAFAGLLVHQTLEQIHRMILDGQFDILKEDKIHAIFERTFKFLACTGMQPIDREQKEKARQHILNYIYNNQQELQRIEAAEMSIQVEKSDYVLSGKIDLLLRGSNGLEIVDFKTRARPEPDSERLAFYTQQLYVYAYALQKRTGQLPRRLFLYWTAEENKEDAITAIAYSHVQIEQANRNFDEIIAKIMQQQFTIELPPHAEICSQCDIRRLCSNQGVI